ncbi:MAG: hypothetical protein ACTHJ1_10675 [Bordetella sp.]|uniref:hypothetical protein n=1 Tax=Bordetella sp. TaxID=28081 RepID=UPI003F7C5CBC
MNKTIEPIVDDLRKMTSNEAAEWLIERYPIGSAKWGDAIVIMAHLSWKKADQIRLADHYLSRLPFASAKPYEVFASFMKVSRLVDILRKNAPVGTADRSLLEYHAGPVLMRAAQTPEDREMVENFRLELNTR